MVCIFDRTVRIMRGYYHCVIPLIVGMSILLFLLTFWHFSASQKFAWHHSVHADEQNIENSEMRNVLKMLQSVDFEVFGTVQGVFFRKYTREKGKELGLKGWVMNTSQGTVQGIAQGKEEKIEEMKQWLKTVGSPMSRIEKCNFSNLRHISKEEFDDFFIKN